MYLNVHVLLAADFRYVILQKRFKFIPGYAKFWHITDVDEYLIQLFVSQNMTGIIIKLNLVSWDIVVPSRFFMELPSQPLKLGDG